MTLKERVPQIVAELAKEFRSFGGEQPTPGVISTALKGYKPMFAMGVDIEQVVWAVIAKLKMTPGEKVPADKDREKCNYSYMGKSCTIKRPHTHADL